MTTTTTEQRPFREAVQVLDDLWKIADVKGHSFVYDGIVPSSQGGESPGCSYVERDELDNPTAPGCIVGHWLFSHGVTLRVLGDNEGYYTGYLHNVYDRDLPFRLTSEARDMLYRVQQLQDNKTPWGDAIRQVAEAMDLI